jgi:hypothetical protein
MKEIRAKYKINPQGFNSIKDYSEINNNKLKIAIIGDSYIEGFQGDVSESIGRLIEKEANNTIEVHEYGMSGWNIIDYQLYYTQYVKNKYDVTFILMSNEDFRHIEPSSFGKGNESTKNTLLRKLYNKTFFIRYLNMNHGLKSKLIELFSFPNYNKNSLSNSSFEINNTTSYFEIFDSSCIILHESKKLNLENFKALKLKTLEIEHKIYPINFGFDSHWNDNGRQNVASTIYYFLVEESFLKP